MSSHLPDIRTLRLLIAVAELGSLSAAARRTGIAQPNASRLLRGAEADLGLSLVLRQHTGSVLTDDGRVVVEWARSVVASADELMDAAKALRHAHLSNLTVSASMTVAEYLMPGWLAAFHRQHPNVEVSLGVHNSQEVCDEVTGGAADVGFVESPSVAPGLKRQTVTHDRLVVITSSDHPWSRRRKPITTTELAATPLIVREPGSGTRGTLDRALAHHTPVDPLLQLSSNAAIKVSVQAGLAPAVLSAHAVGAELRSGSLKEVATDAALRRPIRAVWASARLRGPAADLVRLAQRLTT
ncbi:MAG: LysR family transcriptional regulator [Nocardioidaceae bacterium]